jgi:hypothetical protein
MLGALAHSPSDDAGSGEDASDRPAQAFNVSPGTYVGNLTPGSYEDDLDDYDSYADDNITKDVDWYRANATGETTTCTSATFSLDDEPNNETRVHIREPALDSARLNTTTTSTGQTLAMVGPSPQDTQIGLTAQTPPRVTQYDLSIDVLRLQNVENDGGSGGTADRIPGPCFGGELEDMETHEWTFEAQEGELLFVSIGTELTRADDLALVAPNGTEVGSITSEGDIALGAAMLDQDGNWTLRADGGDSGLLMTTASTYVVSFSIVDPDPEEEEDPCDPHCMSTG